MKKLLITILILCSTSVYTQKRIFGKVTDANKKPLIGASVYLNNTSIGTTTDENGEFYLYALEGYDLVASYLGYHVSKLKLNRKNMGNYIAFKLTPKVGVLDEVVIKKRKKISRSKRALYLRMFKRNFLGRTNAAKTCRIINDDALIFDYDEKTKNLDVSASDYIIIKNKHLGYEIHYDLIHFLLEPERVTYLGFTRYKELEGSQWKKRQWKENRIKAYNGSFRHFLKTIINDDNLKEKGFVVDNFKIIKNPKRPSEEDIRKAQKLVDRKGRLQRNPFSGDIELNLNIEAAEQTLKLASLDRYIEEDLKKDLEFRDFVKYDSISKNFSLFFSDYLRVTYLNEPEEKNFTTGDSEKFPYQISNITLYNKEVRIVKFKGILEGPLNVLLEKYWRYEKVADALPLDYHPKQ